ncbi:MAG: putative virulence factor, partial [Bacteroidetes bacterium]|nr:putative virulence factor [Bacteroidota bacterium]
PAAAMYGESQMGKSYLVGGLLSESKKPFTVIDGEGNNFDFINKINPIGKGAESTSLITRFSTDYEWKNPAFPVKAKLLSPSDLVLVLCDSYYNDVKAKIDISLKSDAISEKVSILCSKYENKPVQQTFLGEDDILDIYDYFYSNFSTKATNVIHSVFFEKIPYLITKTQLDEWGEIFALLWNNNEKITKLFSELLKQYGNLDFTNEIYLPIETVLRDNGTLLDVARLHEIYGKYEGSEPNYKAETAIMILKNGQEKIVNSFSKSYLCALTAELIFQLPKDLETSKQFLKNTDLLDFPGARHRLGIHEDDIDDKVIPQMLLRGKVAYLFSKYSYSEKINILLFCHSDRQSAQSVMPEMLANWIGDMIGKTPKERYDFIEGTNGSKVPPLFVVSTMFNLDLQFDFNNDRENNRNFLDSRWEKRFLKVLKREIFGSETYHWLNEWTTNKQNFQNIYLLRDFYYSSETNSKIYEGYNENKIEKQEIIPQTYPNFRKDLRQSFIEYDFVKQHLENPVESWDKATSINEDGTQLIIDKLTIAANNINAARHGKTIRELNAIKQDVFDLLKEYYNSSDKADSLLKAIKTAGNVQAKLASAFGVNHYFFGTMMNELMLNQSDVFALYLEKIRDIERRDVVNMDKYSGYRLKVPELNPNDSFETNLERLRVKFEMQTSKECQDFFEKEEGIDLNELFNGNAQRVKNFSQVLAGALETYWFDTYMLENRQKLANIFSEEGLHSIQDMLRNLFKELQITKVIAEKIRNYVDGYRNIEEVYEMIADISTEIINKFINSVGLEYYAESHFKDLENVRKNITTELFWEHNDLKFEQNSSEEVAELITDMGNLSDLLNQNPLPAKVKRLPNYRNYIMWSDLLKAGFVTASGVPNYDPIANEKLGEIIKQCQAINC